MKKILMSVLLLVILVPIFSDACPSGMNYAGDVACYEVCQHYSVSTSFRAVGRGECSRQMLYIDVISPTQVNMRYSPPGENRIITEYCSMGRSGWTNEKGWDMDRKYELLFQFCIERANIRR